MGQEGKFPESIKPGKHQRHQQQQQQPARTHAHSHAHTYTVLYILASQLEPLSLENASNPNILAIEEDISIKNLKMEHLISLNV